MLWIGTSWKMTHLIADARRYGTALAQARIPDGIQVFVLPPLTAFAALRAALPPQSRILLGVQNAHWEVDAESTGEVSMAMAEDLGARIVEIGHSERRRKFGETDVVIAHKARAASDAGLIPLICVGETADMRAAGGSESSVRQQVRAALDLLTPSDIAETLIAYEPVWAIGKSGVPASADQIGPVIAVIHDEVRRVSGGRGLGVLYGGSVTVGNGDELIRVPGVEGLFVGRSAWRADGLLALVETARQADVDAVVADWKDRR